MHYKKYKSILSAKNGMNIYRGCSHGCIYCDSRSTCYQINHPFEDIEVKQDAPKMLDIELSKKRNPVMVATGAMTDPYCHVENETQYTKQCLEVILKHNCGVAIQTKSDRILRDIDIIEKINNCSKAVVEMTLTTFDDELCKIIEPNVCVTSKRVEVLKECSKRGIPTIVWLCPILPFINDTEENMLGLLDYCSQANVYGILYFGAGLTLREGNREYYYSQLDKHFPGLSKIYENKYRNSYEVASDKSYQLDKLFYEQCFKRNIVTGNDRLFRYMAEYPKKFEQTSLF